MSLTTQAVSGSISALTLIKNYLDNPSLSIAVRASTVPLALPGTTVSLQCETYKEVLPSEISQQLIIDSNAGQKLYVSDNIAPKPRTWNIKGYVGAAPWELLASPVLQITQAKKVALLRQMRESREMLVFRTKNGGELVFVGIKEWEIDSNPSIQNRIPITMTIQEIPILSYVNGQIGIPVGSANPAGIGDKVGQVLAQSTSIAAIALSIGSTAIDSLTATDEVKDSLNIPARKTIKGTYIITMPATTPGNSFSFDAKVLGHTYNFAMKYTTAWNVIVTFPDGSIRNAALYPNTMNWSGYGDFGLVAKTELQDITETDLQLITLYMVKWE